MIRALLVASLVSVESADVKGWAEKYCGQLAKLQDQKMVLDPEGTKKAFAEFRSIFSEKLDCSQDPYNPFIGYNLEGASFDECQVAESDAAAKYPKAQLSETTCLEIIADEATHTGTIWLEFGNSGELRSKFKTRAAFVFKVDDDICTAYHTVFDSYNLLHSDDSQTIALAEAAPAASHGHHHYNHGGVRKWAKQYCSQLSKLQSQNIMLDPEGMKQAFSEFKSYFTDSLDCSQDPYNPKIGYNLEGATFDQCQAAAFKAATHYDNAELSQATCLDIIADEGKGTGAIWMEFGNTGKLRSKFYTRGAFRFKIDGGKCFEYHTVFDSYNVLPHVDIAAILPYSSDTVALFLVLLVVAVVAGAFAGVKMWKKKKDILLEHEVLG